MNELVDAVIVLPVLAAMIMGALPTPEIKTTAYHLRKQPPPLKRTQL